MGKHLVIGAGAVGTATAQALAAAGHAVTVVSRRGRAVGDDRIAPIAADAADVQSLTRLAEGSDAIYNCANPAYHRWAEEWPPMADAMLVAAERSGAGLVTMSNLYGYGPVDHPMTTQDPLDATFKNGRIRAEMWNRAKAAHDAGLVNVTEARASDFFGPNTAETSHIGRAIPRILAGKSVQVLGDPDQPHSWSFVPDVGRTLATLGTSEESWGRPWHVPSGPPRSQRQMFEQVAKLAGERPPKVTRIPDAVVRAIGVFSPKMRALSTVSYQFDAPFILDSSETESTFGIGPLPLDEALAMSIEAVRGPVLLGEGDVFVE